MLLHPHFLIFTLFPHSPAICQYLWFCKTKLSCFCAFLQIVGFFFVLPGMPFPLYMWNKFRSSPCSNITSSVVTLYVPYRHSEFSSSQKSQSTSYFLGSRWSHSCLGCHIKKQKVRWLSCPYKCSTWRKHSISSLFMCLSSAHKCEKLERRVSTYYSNLMHSMVIGT